MIVKDIVRHIENHIPLHLAEKYDNVGLLVGEMNQEVKKIYLALTPTDEVIEEAIKVGADMIVTHHPYSLSKFGKVTSETTDGRKIIKLIQNNISLYAAHTNLDKSHDTINEILFNKLGLVSQGLFREEYYEKLYKLVTYVPATHSEIVRESIGDAGAGRLGDYSHCSFSDTGVGAFKPLEGSNPAIGEVGALERVEEVRIEAVVRKKDLSHVLSQLKVSHPYETVAYDLYEMVINADVKGYGLKGEFTEPKSLEEVITMVKEKYDAEHVSYVGEMSQMVQSVVICSGSATDFMNEVIAAGADLFITGDVRYHYAVEAMDNGLAIIDPSHHHTEKWVVDILKDLLDVLALDLVMDTISTNPIKII